MVKLLLPLAVVQLLAMVCCRVVSDSFDDDREQYGHRYGSNQNRRADWEKDEISVENEIARPQPFGLGAKPHNNHKPAHQEYACGRPMADKRLKEQQQQQLVPGDQQQVTRNKYRPTEIRMPRIIGGDETAPGEFPWTVSVKLNGQPICGGSLIDHNWILTAAHCVVGYNPKNLTIRLGAYRIKDISETQTVDLPVSMFIVHKEYSMPRPFSNDIAMLKLSESVEFSDYIIPICLPREDRPFPATISQLTSAPSGSSHTGNNINSDDVGGIVVSTKMSDLDIAKCFNRLEQNYLNSIGLGTTLAPPSIELGKTSTLRPQPPPQPSTSSPIRLGSYGDLLDPILMGVSDSSASFQRKPIHNNQLRYPLDPQVFSMASLESSPANNHVYYQLMHQHQQPWLAKAAKPQGRSTIRLSRLPISKELLREIQSVGSGPMQTLGLQQGDFVAMANDLNQVMPSSPPPPPPQIVSPQQQQPSMQSQPQEREKVRNLQTPVRSPESSIEGDENDPSKYSTGMSGIVVGWGWVRELDGDDQVNKGFPSVTLQKVKLPILRNNVCEAWFQSQAKKITLLPSQFCAGFNSGGKDACRGDSGGPMIIEDTSNTGRYQLIGIVSAGIGCARPSLPGLYTRVASFLPWIHAQILRY